MYTFRADRWNRKKQFDNAIADCDEAIRLEPSDSFAFQLRGFAWHGKRDYAKAIADFQEAIRLDPNDDMSLGWTAWILATSPEDKIRNGKRAVELVRKAISLTKDKVGGRGAIREILFVEALAAAHAECGEFEDAVRWQERSLEIPRKGDNPDGRLRLKLYRKKQPYREP